MRTIWFALLVLSVVGAASAGIFEQFFGGGEAPQEEGKPVEKTPGRRCCDSFFEAAGLIIV